ncbi:ADL065Wp [Eremothecium gossypii ATCC 10895]|uniref:Respiratory growth induced protein 1 n=1 Tax=Eremothecium gossypii (strain ATCC 10895 / CBS 109.51 / FGSC 9923 / NRRL Y-1056) TaxID=284811 RepID=RGI1_EREGS|nr:ADL065Wp [Eremothecium gossypii ATCC 10895]Q75AJ2.2 RecName: Full=Respiratory growth induced protein 1 [Eremothecium gossypii ATCC 10895]AAS51855.2 ADL065Wp [Eremothecium gossypii ATCC 10895]AEY96152.1 FADL065Wp [Eremothecium gossypii FDAG1]
MTKKDKKQKVKVKTVETKEGEKIRVFEDLDSFETYLRGETEDEEFDHVHCQVRYYPPFVLHESHQDPEKIKESANSHNKKFVRHLHQHVEKHLLKDIKDSLGVPELKFKDKSKEENFNHVVWRYHAPTAVRDREFLVHVTVECHNDTAMVDVDYLTEPMQPAVQSEQVA